MLNDHCLTEMTARAFIKLGSEIQLFFLVLYALGNKSKQCYMTTPIAIYIYSVYQSVPSICFVCVFVCWKLSPHLRVYKSWITGVCSPYVVSLGDFAYYVVGYKSLQLLCILPFGMVCLSAISKMFVKIILPMCILVGIGSSQLSCSWLSVGSVVVCSHAIC